MTGARHRGHLFAKSEVKTKWARHCMPKMCPQFSLTGLLTLSPFCFHTLFSNGSRHIEQSLWSVGIFLTSTSETVSKKLKWAVIFMRSDIVFGESGIVSYRTIQVERFDGIWLSKFCGYLFCAGAIWKRVCCQVGCVDDARISLISGSRASIWR